MRKFQFVTIIVLLISTASKAQINLALNPSLEQYRRCPNNIENIKYANYWSSIIDTAWTATDTLGTPGCVPEYYNSCATNPTLTIPNNLYFFINAHSGNGVANVQVYADNFVTFPSKRDYAQGRLKSNLISGKQYCASFYAILVPNSAYATNKVGAYLDNGSIDTTTICGKPETSYSPQVFSSSIITDTLQWTKIEGSFVAIGNEKFITIGNFFDTDHTDTIREFFPRAVRAGNDWVSWYLIDDVSVIATDAVAYAGRDTAISSRLTDSAWVGNHDGYLPVKWYVNGVLADSNTSGFMVHPAVTTQYVMELTVCGNVTRDTMKVTVWPLGLGNVQTRQLSNVQMAPNPVLNEMMMDGAGGTDVSVMDLAGRVIMGFHVATDKETVDVSGLLPGVYVVAVVDPISGERVCRRVVKE